MSLRGELYQLKREWLEAIDDLKLIVSSSPTSLTLHLIYVPPSQRNLGYGNEIMKELTNFCDLNNLIFHLAPVDDYGIPIENLRRFYEQHGFQMHENSGNGELIRKPLYWDEYIFHGNALR